MKTIRVLLIEDSQFFVQLVNVLLKQASHGEFELTCVESVASGIERLSEGNIDVVLLDLTLPDSTGIETFARIAAADPQIPVVIFTSLDDEHVSLTALQRGATDYLVKNEVNANWLSRSLIYSLQRKRSSDQEDDKEPEHAVEKGILDVRMPQPGDETLVARLTMTKLVSVVALEHAKTQLFNLLAKQRGKTLSLDFDNVEYVSNAAISTLLSVHKRSKAVGSRFVLSNVSPQVLEHFASRRFDKVFEIRERSDSESQ